MLALLVFAVVLVVAAAHQNRLLPKEWHNFRVDSNSSSATVKNYLVTYAYPNSRSCNSEASSVYGLGFGVCMVGYDACGKPLGSATRYTYTKQSGGYLYYTYEYFQKTDCNSAPTYSESTTMVMDECYEGYANKVIDGPNAWEGVNKGVVTLVHLSSNCNENPASWSSTSYNYCFYEPTCQSTKSATYHSKYSKCSGDVASVSYYSGSDGDCKHMVDSETLPATTCHADEGGHIWSSITCNN